MAQLAKPKDMSLEDGGRGSAFFVSPRDFHRKRKGQEDFLVEEKNQETFRPSLFLSLS
jgi:hypothetical protein